MSVMDVDVAIIGAGSAGIVAYKEASRYTQNIALLDGGVLGTTCARVGCMPSKLLVAAAEAAHQSRIAPTFGIVGPGIRVDGRAVMKRIQQERDYFVSTVLQSLAEIPAEHFLREHVRFIESQCLETESGAQIRFRSAVLAVGSRPVIPSILEPLILRHLTSESIFELQDLPHRIAIFGAGATGVELGQALSRLGVEVHIFGRNGHLAGIQDPVVLDCARNLFSQEVSLDLHSKVESVKEISGGVCIQYRDARGEAREEVFDYVLSASGRVSNCDRLALEKSGLTLDHKGVPVFDSATLQCGSHPIFMAGDVNQELSVLHKAVEEGHIAGKNAALFPKVEHEQRTTPLQIVFSDPQIARVGLSLCDIQKQLGDALLAGEVDFSKQGRARVMAANAGVLRVYASALSGEVVGAEMMAPGAEHLAHLLAWAVQQRLTVKQILAMPFYHPVIEEGLRTALKSLQAQFDTHTAPVQSAKSSRTTVTKSAFRKPAFAEKRNPSGIESCMDSGPGV